MRLELGQFVVVTRNMRELKKGTILKVTKLNKDLAIIEDIKTKYRYITYKYCTYVELLKKEVFYV